MKDRVGEREMREEEALRKNREEKGELNTGKMKGRGVEEEEKTAEIMRVK